MATTGISILREFALAKRFLLDKRCALLDNLKDALRDNAKRLKLPMPRKSLFDPSRNLLGEPPR